MDRYCKIWIENEKNKVTFTFASFLGNLFKQSTPSHISVQWLHPLFLYFQHWYQTVGGSNVKSRSWTFSRCRRSSPGGHAGGPVNCRDSCSDSVCTLWAAALRLGLPLFLSICTQLPQADLFRMHHTLMYRFTCGSHTAALFKFPEWTKWMAALILLCVLVVITACAHYWLACKQSSGLSK